MASDAPLGDVGTRLLHEDARVKIWELALAPGQESAPHEHHHDYVIIVVEGDRIAGVPHVRSTGASASYQEVDVAPGSWFRLDRGGIESARNVGTTPYREILIELKD
jgi:predicted metal-dependent enzyme (double-stranded beta helix superfamily)